MRYRLRTIAILLIAALCLVHGPRLFARTSTPLYTQSALLSAPSAAEGVSVTPNGTAWANSSWVQVIASTSTAIDLAGLAYTSQAQSGFDTGQSEIDVGVGGSGSEVAVQTFLMNEADSGQRSQEVVYSPIFTAIGSGQRVSVRIRKGSTTTSAWRIGLIYYAAPMSGNVITTTAQQQGAPSASTASVTPPGTAWSSSGWTQINASIPGDWTITGLSWGPASFGLTADFEMDIGVGAASSEVAVATLRSHDAGGSSWGDPQYLNLWPFVKITSGSRVSVRIRASTTTTNTQKVRLSYYQALSGASAITTSAVPSTIPSAAASIGVTASGTPWANGSWVQAIASTSASVVLTGMNPGAATSSDQEIDVGTGGSGSEVPVWTFRLDDQPNLGSNYTHNFYFGPLIPSGTRVSFRMRSGTASQTQSVAILVVPDTSFSQQSTSAQAVLPAAASSVSIAGPNSSWANSSYGQLTAGIAHTMMITSVAYFAGTTGTTAEIDLATGGSGSETVISTLRTRVSDSTGHFVWHLPVPYLVPASTRLAVRFRENSTSSNSWNFAVNYVPDINVVGASSFPALFIHGTRPWYAALWEGLTR